MANVVRFALPTARTLDVPGVGTFRLGVLDVDANNLRLLAKARYLTDPYGAIELGTMDSETPYPSLPAVPAAPNPDPYPQYATVAEMLADPATLARLVPFWVPGEIVAADVIRVAPDGSTIMRIGSGTTRPTYDPTEEAAWTVVSAGGGGTVADATGSIKGILQLAGDLGGTAASPTVPGLAGKINNTEKGAANGVATLDSGSKLTLSQLPSIALSDFLGAVGSQAAMLTLLGQRGDWATRTDLGADYILIADDPTQLSSWRQITSTGTVTSVAGLTGAVTIGAANLTATGTRDSTTALHGDNVWRVPAGGGGSSLNDAADKIRYVSSTGSDSDDGLSWATAKLTIGSAHTALAGTAGTIYVGAGTYSMAPGFTPADATVIKGAGRGATRINMNANGNLLALTNSVGVVVEDLDLGFASSSITGTLVNLSNAFVCRFNRVGLIGNGTLGTGTANQRGVYTTANAGDNYFFQCFFSTLAVGFHADTVVNWVSHSQFYGCKTAVTGGHATDATNGMFFSHCIFNEVGDYHVNLTGVGQAWYFDFCWFELSTTAIQVGTSAGLGPTLFSLTNCSLAGQTTTLVLNACETTVLEGLQFINPGSTPVDVSCPTPQYLPYGRIGQVNSYNRTSEAIRAVVPAQWEGTGRIAQRTVTGAYTVANADVKGYALHSTSASGFTLTVPQDSAATSLAIGTSIPWRQAAAGQITFAAGSGATLVSRGSVFKSAGQYAEGLLTKIAANTWLLSGDIVA